MRAIQAHTWRPLTRWFLLRDVLRVPLLAAGHRCPGLYSGMARGAARERVGALASYRVSLLVPGRTRDAPAQRTAAVCAPSGPPDPVVVVLVRVVVLVEVVRVEVEVVEVAAGEPGDRSPGQEMDANRECPLGRDRGLLRVR